MAIDPNIALSVKPVQLANPLEQYMQVQQIQQAQNQNRLADLMYSNQQRDADQTMQLNEQYKNAIGADGNIDRTKLFGGIASAGLGSKLPAIQKQFLDTDTAQANLKKVGAETGKITQETTGMADDQREKKRQKAIVDIAGFTSPQDALASLAAHEKAGDLTPEAAAGVRATIPQNPADFPKWQIGMLQRIMSAGDALKQLSPDANARLQSDTSIKTAKIQANTSRANNQDTIKKDYVVAGLNPDGTPSGEIETTAQAIAKGQLPPPSGMALMNPKNQRVLARVMEINPDYDYTTVAAKKKAAADFASGPLGNALRSVSTANDHLDQLGELVDALGNGNTQIINKAKNAYLTATGNPAPTNFDAIKNIVGQEVVKAIVAGGGSMTEREEAAKTFSTASSPAQLKGAIQHYRMVMGAQADNLMEQRRAAGLPDSTLPNYKKGSAAAPSSPAQNGLPAGWSVEVH
jgi:hypothetical protein